MEICCRFLSREKWRENGGKMAGKWRENGGKMGVFDSKCCLILKKLDHNYIVFVFLRKAPFFPPEIGKIAENSYLNIDHGNIFLNKRLPPETLVGFKLINSNS
jgi:hypothetical protein